MSLFDDVGEFHERFDLPRTITRGSQRPGMIPPDQFMFRYGFLQEELAELLKAYRDEDLIKIADALADLVYVALGTAHFFGIPFDRVWSEVHRANMEKIRSRGRHDPRSKRGSEFDVVKPEGWDPPDIPGALRG